MKKIKQCNIQKFIIFCDMITEKIKQESAGPCLKKGMKEDLKKFEKNFESETKQ